MIQKMYYVCSSLLSQQVYTVSVYIIISPGSDSFLFVYCYPSFFSVLYVDLTSL